MTVDTDEQTHLYPTDEHDPYNPNHVITLVLDNAMYDEIFHHAMGKGTTRPEHWVEQQISALLAHLRVDSRLIHIDEDGWMT